MATVTRTRSIPTNAQAVWDVLADFSTISQWAGFVDHSSMLQGGPLEVGSTRRIQAGRLVVLERLIEFDPPTSLEYEIEGLPERISSVRNRWHLRSTGDTTTASITTTVTIGPRPPQQLAERVVGRVLASRSDAMLAGLAPHLERTHV